MYFGKLMPEPNHLSFIFLFNSYIRHFNFTGILQCCFLCYATQPCKPIYSNSRIWKRGNGALSTPGPGDNFQMDLNSIGDNLCIRHRDRVPCLPSFCRNADTFRVIWCGRFGCFISLHTDKRAGEDKKMELTGRIPLFRNFWNRFLIKITFW